MKLNNVEEAKELLYSMVQVVQSGASTYEEEAEQLFEVYCDAERNGKSEADDEISELKETIRKRNLLIKQLRENKTTIKINSFEIENYCKEHSCEVAEVVIHGQILEISFSNNEQKYVELSVLLN
jgi:uncharacterized membrane protein YgaE (UPF0421/DUF939 family)